MTTMILSLALVSLPVLIPFTEAQTIEQTEESVSMLLGDDVYAAGATVNITDAIAGDVNAAGATVRIDSTVEEDVQAAGGTVSIKGAVQDDVRIAGGDIVIDADVQGDVLVFGGTITIANNATIAGNLIAAGGTISVDGTVQGNVHVNGGTVALDGTVGGHVTASAPQLSLGENASIAGTMRYWKEGSALNADGKVQGGATLDPTLRKTHDNEGAQAGAAAAIAGALSIFSILTAAVSIAVFMLVTRTFFTDSAKTLRKYPWKSLLTGFLFFIATPFVFILLAITIVGLPLAAAVLAVYVLSIVFATVLTAMVLARLAEMRWSTKPWHPAAAYAAALGIYAALKVLMAVPIIGWLAGIAAVCCGYGAVLMVKYDKLQRVR